MSKELLAQLETIEEGRKWAIARVSWYQQAGKNLVSETQYNAARALLILHRMSFPDHQMWTGKDVARTAPPEEASDG